MVKKLGQVNEICNEDFVYSYFTNMNMQALQVSEIDLALRKF